MSATLRDVAKAAGVSLATASYALSGKGMLKSETRVAVLRAARELGYRTPIRLKRRIALIEAAPRGVRADLADGFVQILRQHDFALQPIAWPAAANAEAGLPTTIRERQVDGAFVFGGLIDPHFAERLAAAVPTLFLGGTYLDLDVDSVWSDATQGVHKAVSHLADLGHRRIALIPGPTATFTTAEKIAGYQQALQARGIAYRPEFVRITDDFGERSGVTAAQEFLNSPDPPTAIIAGQPPLAVGCARYAQSIGLAIPGRLSIIAFEDRSDLAAITPVLSAIDIRVPDIVAVAHATLMARIQDPARAAQRIRTATKLILRGSIGPPPA